MRAVLYIITGLLLFGLIYQCERSAEYKELSEANMQALTDTVTHYRNALGTQTASIKTLQLDRQQLQKVLVEKDSELKALVKGFAKVNNVTNFKSDIEFEPIAIAYDEPIQLNTADSTVRFMRTGTVFNKWYSLSYKLDNDSIVIHPFTTYTETTVITGLKRKWLLGRQTLTTDITNTNPYITVTQIKAAETTVPVPWYKKWYIWLGAGVIGGLLVK